MTPEHVGGGLDRRFETLVDKVQVGLGDPTWSKQFTKRTVTLYRRGDPTTRALAKLPSLAPHLNSVLVDPTEGELYLLQWRRAKIPPEYEILGIEPQTGRDYAQHPPKTKIPKRLTYAHFAKGVDVLQRGISEILSQYLVEGGVKAREVDQIKGVLGHVLVLRAYKASFKELSGKDLDRILSDNIKFLEENGFLNPQSPEKQRIQELLQRGFRDSRGRKNYFAALSRLYALELAILKRRATITAVLGKYSGTLTIVELTRHLTRFALEEADRTLERLLERPAFVDPALSEQSKEVRLKEARAAWEILRTVSHSLARNVEVRPYILVARTAIACLGTMKLPGGTIGAKVLERRASKGIHIPTASDHLRNGDFVAARQLIERVRQMLEKTLDVHEDWRTVKPSRKAKKRGNSPTPSRS